MKLIDGQRYLSRDSQLVRVETDELAEHEGINRGDWIVLDQGVAVGVVRGRAPKAPKNEEAKA